MSAVVLPRRLYSALRVVLTATLCSTITACGGGGSDSAGGITTPPAIQVGTVTVSVPTTTLQVGAQVTAGAEVRSTAGAALTGRTISWSSSDAAVASVTDAGVITGVAPGVATITATSEGRAGVAAITVIPAPVNAVVVSAPTPTVVVDRTLQASVLLRDERGATLSGRTVSWSSSTPAVATVNDAGVITGVGAGTAVITATSESKSGTLSITVVPPAVNSVTLSLAQPIIPQGSSTTVTATLRDDRNVVLTGRIVQYSSSDVSVASVNDAGTVTAVAVGTATITATSEGKSGTAAITVIQPPVASVVVGLSQGAVLPGTTVQAQLLLRDAAGRQLTGRPVSWTSSNPAIASVNGSGLISALAPGSVIISATSEGQTGQAALQVLTPVATVVINGSTRVKVGDTYSYTATARAADGTVLERPVTWRVRETARAVITPNGSLLPLQAGSFTIVAQIDGSEWDASYTAYDWLSLTGATTTYEYLEADSRVANRFGTLAYPELVLSCGSTGSFFVWLRFPHMVTQNGLVVFGFDGGASIAQNWTELAPDYNTLWKPGSNTTTKAFATQIADARRFGIAFGEFNVSSSRSASFRVTGLAPRLPALFAKCPAALKLPGTANGSNEPSLVDRAAVLQAFAARDAARGGAGISAQMTQDAQARAERGPAATGSPMLDSWPRWTVPESTPARRVPR